MQETCKIDLSHPNQHAELASSSLAALPRMPGGPERLSAVLESCWQPSFWQWQSETSTLAGEMGMPIQPQIRPRKLYAIEPCCGCHRSIRGKRSRSRSRPWACGDAALDRSLVCRVLSIVNYFHNGRSRSAFVKALTHVTSSMRTRRTSS